MAKDKVRPLKFENTTDGTEFDEYPTELDPQEDYVSAKGVAFENADDKTIDIDPVSGYIRFNDVVSSGVSSIDIKNNKDHAADIGNPHGLTPDDIPGFDAAAADAVSGTSVSLWRRWFGA